MDRFKILKNPDLKPCHAPKPLFPDPVRILVQLNQSQFSAFSQIYGRTSGRATFVVDTESVNLEALYGFVDLSAQGVPRSGVINAPTDDSRENNSIQESIPDRLQDMTPEEVKAEPRSQRNQPQPWVRHRKKLPWE